MKTEPETYSFEQLLKDGKTNWNGVRNFQARNNLKKIAKGDIVIIYHSGDDKSAVGVARVVREAYPDPDPETQGDWVQVDLEPVQGFRQPVSLATIKSTVSLSDMPLIRQSRLSVMSIGIGHYKTILKLGKTEV